MTYLAKNIPVAVFNSSLSQVAYIDDYETASFEHNWYQPGAFQMTINFNKPNALTFNGFDPKGAALYIMWNQDPNRCAKITHVGAKVDEKGKGGQALTVEGFECWNMFGQRIMLPTSGTTNYTLSGTPEYCIKQAISDHAGPTATDSNRAMALLSIVANAGRSQTGYPTYLLNAQNTNLLDELKKCAVSSQMGIVSYLNLTTGKIMLDVQLGVDRTLGNAGGNPVCVFSSQYDDAQKSAWDMMEDSYANYVYVRGSGSSGLQSQLGLPASSPPTGESRFELFVDASSIPQTDPSLVTDMTSWGNQVLAQNQFRSFFQVDPLAYSPLVYTVDYNVGDLVTVQDFNVSQSCRIISVAETVENLKYTLSSTFDKLVPDLTSQMQAMFAQIASTVNNSQSTPVYTTNASGGAVQLSDGTMICWAVKATTITTSVASGSLYYQNQAFTFPVQFVGAVPVILPMVNYSAGSTWPGDNFSPSLTGFTGTYFGNGNTNACYPGYIAIGRWKT